VARMQLVVSNFARENDERIFVSFDDVERLHRDQLRRFHHIDGAQTSSSHSRAPDEMFLA
jgi:hypothetical protein